MKRILLLIGMIVMVLFVTACGDVDSDETKDAETDDDIVTAETDVENIDSETVEEVETIEEAEEEPIDPEELTPEGKVLYNILELMDDGSAFDSGSYIPGDIPEGEYVFAMFDGGGQYYAEKELNGDIIDNENFDSFGYVYVHGVGNIETSGVLVNVEDLEAIGASGAKEIYEILNDASEYKDSGFYKVGVDIEPGEYVIESVSDGYVGIMSGPVGNGDIINNEIFDGRHAIKIEEGQYLKVSRGTIEK